MRNKPQIRRFRLAALVGIFLIGTMGMAHADTPAHAAESQETDVGRKRFAEGVAAFKSGKYEEARVSFQQSYAVKPAPPALRNLAAAELKTKRYLDAARHFSTYLKTTKPSEIDRADVVQQSLAEAKTHCAMLVVETNVAGAVIGVDGEIIGRTPLDADPWLLEPGEHAVTARLEGYDDHNERQRLEAGRTTRIFVALQPNGITARSPLAATPAPAAKLASSSEGRTPGVGEEPHVMQPLPPSPDSAARVSVVPLAIGGAITITGLAFGIGYSVASNSNAQDHDALLASIPGPSPKCGNMTPYAAECAEMQRLGDKSDTQRNMATAGFVVAGVAGAATLAYWLWPRSSRSQGMVVPTVAPAYAGIQWRSSF
jgi:PEGA domain